MSGVRIASPALKKRTPPSARAGGGCRSGVGRAGSRSQGRVTEDTRGSLITNEQPHATANPLQGDDIACFSVEPVAINQPTIPSITFVCEPIGNLHATMLHQLGITPEKTIYRHHGRNARPTDVDGKSLSPLITGSSSPQGE